MRKQFPYQNKPDDVTSKNLKSRAAKSPIIMRIDNIAWDATPEMVEKFLPPNVLAETLQPVHLLIDRRDGKSKDYLVSFFTRMFCYISGTSHISLVR